MLCMYEHCQAHLRDQGKTILCQFNDIENDWPKYSDPKELDK